MKLRGHGRFGRNNLVFGELQSTGRITKDSDSSVRIAGVYSLQVFSTDKTLTISTAPQPHRGPADRPSGVAGSFYPSDAEGLRQTVEQLLAQALPDALPRRAVSAAMVPHAGLRYSGAIAARVLQSIELPRTIIVLGPKHTPP